MKKILLLMIIPALLAGFWEKKFGGMTVKEAFPDERVARLVDTASHGDLQEVDAQIRAGADVNAVGRDGITPLLWVMGTRNFKGMEHLLKAGANPNYEDAKRGISAMYLAAGGDRPDFLELILKYGGDPNLRGGEHDEPMLHIAVSQLREKNIEILLKRGADINGHTGMMKHTAADNALTFGRFDLVVYFLDRGLTYNLRGLAKGVEITQVPKESKQQRTKEKVIEMLRARGVKFPVFIAGLSRQPDSAALQKELERAFPDSRARDAYIQKYGYGMNAYYSLYLEKVMPDRAKREAWLREYDGDAKDAYNAWLLEHGDELVAKIVEQAARGDFKGVDSLLREGAHVNMVGIDGATPLMRLATAGSLRGAEYLLKLGADPNYKDQKGRSAMYTSAAKGDLKLLELLLGRGGDPNLYGPEGDPLLYAVVRTGGKEGIDLLLKHGANINIHRWSRDSAAEEAVQKGRLELAAYLLERGLNKNLQDLAAVVNSVQVPAGHAQQRWKEQVIEMLKARGVSVRAPGAGKGK